MYPVSASQIDKFDTCQRRWGFHYISGIKEDAGASADLGKEMHGIGEEYLKTGAYPDRLTQAGAMFISGLPYLPPPGSGGVEGKIDFVIAGVRYLGFIDYRGSRVPGFDPDQIVVLDHKSSSDPKKYGLWTKAAFLMNPQALIYATHEVTVNEAPDAHMRWLYYWSKTKSGSRQRCEPSDVVLLKSELEDVFEPVVHNKAKEIVRLKVLAPDPNELEPNADACYKYNKPCPYMSVCAPLTTRQRIEGALKLENKKMAAAELTLLEKIELAKKAKNGVSAAPPPVAQTDQINPPEAKAAPAPVVTKAAAPKAESLPVALQGLKGNHGGNVAKVLRAIADLLEG